jgi:hypothetical protein
VPEDSGVEVCGAESVDGGGAEVYKEGKDIAGTRVFGIDTPWFEGFLELYAAGMWRNCSSIVGFVDS